MFRFRLQISHRHLMRAPSALYRLSVDRFRSRPTLRTAQDHHWPGWQAQIAAIPSVVLNRSNFVHYGVQSSGHELMHRFWLMSLDKIGLPAVTGEEMSKFLVIHPAKHSRICDLVPVEMQDGQHGTVTCRIEKLVAMPACCQRSGFRLTVSHHAAREQVWVVEHRAASVHDRITQFSTFVDGARGLGRRVARNSSGEGELFEQSLYALFILRDVRIKLAVAALQVRIRNHSGAAVAGTSNVNDIQVVVLNQAIEMDVDEVQTGCRPPVP